jgi:3-(3-hydroxy-phenyl)propionate hydroxylase
VIRRSLAPRLHLIPGLRTRLVDSSTPPLRRSALILKSWRRHGLAGTLCPNPLVDDAVRLDARLGNGFALVTAKPLEPSRVQELQLRGATVVTAQPGTELAQWLCGGRALAAVVRPDRTVMQAGARLRPLCDALARLAPTDQPRRQASVRMAEKR